MNHGIRLPKRCLALLLAAILIASNFSGLANRVNAVEDNSVTVSVGQIVADNYTLTDAEKELLESGLLTGGTITFTAPTDSSLIEVDNGEKTIEAATFTDDQGNVWIPTAAAIYVGENKMEDVALSNGKGTYAYAENAFSVKVTYTLDVEIAASLQETLLKAPAALKNGVSNMKTAFDATDANLGTVVLAMDILSQLADGISLGFVSAQFDTQAAIDATEHLEQQIAANDGKLDMQLWNEAYVAATSKAQFLMEHGAEYMAVIISIYEDLNAIRSDALMNNTILDSYLQNNQPSDYTAWMALKGILSNTVSTLEPAANGDWSVLEADVLKADLTALEYATLDVLIGNIDSLTELPEVKNPLTVTTATVALNMSMFDVTVQVVLKAVDENNDIVVFDTKQVILTLVENATAAEIQAAVAANGIENAALEAWVGIYLAEHFEASASALPNNLTDDITYTITYSPKYYTATFDYAEEQSLPYGFKLELPRHEDPAQAYDYYVNGEKFAQGVEYVIDGNVEITRVVGKAYTPGQLLSIIAANYGNAKLGEILKSGALFGDEAVNVRYPDATDDSLLTLESGVLSAPNYESSYNGLVWVPYSYGANGTENLFSGNTADFSGKSAKVIYRLALTNYTEAEVKAWLDLAVVLSNEAEGQIDALNRLSAYTDTMGQLDKTKLGALNGVIDVTDMHSDPQKNEELKAYFKGIVSNIIAECLESDGQLRIFHMMQEYQAEGLIYYYQNSAAFQNELATVSGYLNGMLADQEKMDALTVLVTAAGFPEYAEKIQNVGNALATMEAELIAPNPAIDVSSENLDDLVAALLITGDASYTEYGTLYLKSDVLTVTDSSMKKVQIFVNGSVVDTLVFDFGYTLTDNDVAALQASLDAYIAAHYGANVKYYNVTSNIALADLVGTALEADINVQFTYTAKEFIVKIDGVADQIITIENLKINLPKSNVSNLLYTYLIDGEEITTATYTFTAEQLDRLFVNNTYTVVRTVVDMGAAKLQQIVNDLNAQLGAGSVILVTNGNGEFVGMKITVEAAEMMDFIMGLTAYSYIGMNNEGLMYLMEDDSGNYMTELSLQTIINALLSDDSFSSETLIALGENGKGKLMNTTLQLGNDANNLIYNLDLEINLASVPSQMATVAEGLKMARGYLKFYSNNGVMEFEVNLPDQVYGAYLVALVATGNVDKSDANAIDQAIAFQFLLDYFDAVMDSGSDMTTLQNTLDMLGVNMTVEQYQKYFDAFVNAREDEMFTYFADETGLTIDLNIPGKAAISRVLSLIGMGGDQLNTYLGMVKENKDGGVIVAGAHATMSEGREYCAILLDVNASGLRNKYECIRTQDDFATLYNELSGIAGYATIILLDDVDIDLDIAGTTLLDLNGHNVDGVITGLGNLFIIDSSMDTYHAGTAKGVSGNVTVIAGNYLTDVSSYLKDGYYMDGITVRNAMYYIESDENGNTVFAVNSDVYKDEHVDGYMPDIRAIALDMVIDLVLNYSTTACLMVEGNTVYDVNFVDLLDLLKNRSGEKVIDMLLACVDAAGISTITNTIIADLLDFNAIYEALRQDTVVASYDLTFAPWQVTVERTAADYLTLSIKANEKMQKTSSLGLRLEGNSSDYLMNLAYELAGIVEDDTYVEVEIDQPIYNNKELDVGVHGNSMVSLDMSKNSDYAKMLAIILAYGNADKAEAVAAAINAGDVAALKSIVDNTTVAELFTALKVMNRNTTLKEMAQAIGVTVDVTSTDKLEHVFHLILVSAGKALEELDITGMNSKFGSLYDEATGYYVLDKFDIYRTGEVNVRSYSALYEIEVGELIFRLKLFGEHTHDFGEWIIDFEPTCHTEGLKYRVCACGEIETEIIPMVAHSFTNFISDGNATCTQDGTETAYCDYGCGESFTRTAEGSATGHNMGEWVENLPECQCETWGERVRECQNGCGHTESEPIPPRGHIWVDGICQCCGKVDTPTNTSDILIGGVITLLIASGSCCAIVIGKRKKENEAE